MTSIQHENKELMILQVNEQDIVSQVTSIKLEEFSIKLYRSSIISQEVNDIFAALDNTVAPEIRLRYLVLQVCEGVKRDVAVFQHFLKILGDYGGRAEVVSKRISAEWRVCERGAECQAIGYGAGNSEAVDGELIEEDVTYLMKILDGVTFKWEELGIALGLPRGVLEECSSGKSNVVRLHKLLCMWVKGLHPSALPASLKNLKQGLARESVGVVDVALSLERKFWEAKRPVPTLEVGRIPGLATGLSIVQHSKKTEVADGKSTLLEVEFIEGEGVCYQWMKDGKSLSDTLAYSGTRTAILAIRQARQGTGGNYTCHVMNGTEEVISKEVLLTVIFSPEKKQLIDSYSMDTDVPEDTWPPKMTNTFINLALIKKKKGVTYDYKYSVRGNEDDILETKEKIDYEEVFGCYKKGVVLIEGRPGSGKTTLVHKVTRDWASGAEVLKNANLVFLIPLRSLANTKTENLSDILGRLYLDREECDKVVCDIKQSKGEGVCFLIDGLDEFHPQDETQSVIHQLLYNKYLPAAMVIVASRPVATDKLRRKPHVTRHIEVLGFNSRQIHEYIDNYPFTCQSDKLASQLKAYLNSHHNLLHMCYLPVHVAMICFLYDHDNGVIPPTETKIYEHFTRSIILRKQRRTNEDAHLGALEDLCGDDRESFSNICHLALEMTILSIQTVNQKDIKVRLSLGTGRNDAAFLGLVTIDRTVSLAGLDNTYAFPHLTFQEFLAAFYIANLKRDEQMAMIRLHTGKKYMQVVWKFYCGLVNFEDSIGQVQYIISSTGMGEGEATLYGLQCAFESQQLIVCDSLVQGSSGELSYNRCTLTLSDMSAVAYVISITSHPVTLLAMCACHLHDDHVRTLMENVSHNKLKFIKALSLSENNIGDAGATYLAQSLKSCKNLQHLDLSINNISDAGATSLAQALKSCNNLQALYLSTNNIGDAGVTALAQALTSCNNLRDLLLSYNNIGDDGATSLAEALKSCNNPQDLFLSYAARATSIAQAQKSCNNLQNLYLSDNYIGDAGATSLAQALKSRNNLQLLSFYNNYIGDAGATVLAQALKSCINLQSLDLYNNNIGDAGKATLRAHLKHPRLQL